MERDPLFEDIERLTATLREVEQENQRLTISRETLVNEIDCQLVEGNELRDRLTALEGALKAKAEEVAQRLEAAGISWNDEAGTELDGEPLRLWDDDGEPLHGHPWIAGQCYMRKQAARVVREAFAALLSAPAANSRTSDAEAEIQRIQRLPFYGAKVPPTGPYVLVSELFPHLSTALQAGSAPAAAGSAGQE